MLPPEPAWLIVPIEFPIFPRFYLFDRRLHLRDVPLDFGPVGGGQDESRQFATVELLLMTEVLVVMRMSNSLSANCSKSPLTSLDQLCSYAVAP